MASFDSVLLSLRQLGFYDFLLPWLFVFAIVYGVLKTTRLFGDDNKRISAALALVVAFFAVGFGGKVLSSFFSSIFGGASIVLAGVLVIIIFIGLVGYHPRDLGKTGTLVVLVIVGIVLWMLSVGSAQGVGFSPLLSPDLIAFLFVIVIIVLAVWVIMRGGEAATTPAGGRSQENKG